jgi:hypothetical protein
VGEERFEALNPEKADPGLLDSGTFAYGNEDAFDLPGEPQQEKMKGRVANTKN